MIDFHSHILPGMDDGSRDAGETAAMLGEEAGQGVRTVVATPHFYASGDSIRGFLEKRETAYGRAAALDMPGKPEIITGAEVYYFPRMGEAGMLEELCIGGTGALLLELPFAQWTKEILADVRELAEGRGFKIILAHIERYYGFQRDKGIWKSVLGLPAVLQVNAGSFAGGKKRRLALDLLKKGFPVLLGSDCHNMAYRPPDIGEGRLEIEKSLGRRKLDEIDALGAEVLGRKDPENV